MKKLKFECSRKQYPVLKNLRKHLIFVQFYRAQEDTESGSIQLKNSSDHVFSFRELKKTLSCFIFKTIRRYAAASISGQ